ncbi:MAG TPA: hypothetical protein DER33_04835 [Syntrophomonas sp.]|nr:hypothetical protein [Syntrophomonas sp.]
MIPLARSTGFDFQELLQPVKKQLTDEELDKAVGGRGQFAEFSCELALDDETFRMYYESFTRNNCPSFEHNGAELRIERVRFVSTLELNEDTCTNMKNG